MCKVFPLLRRVKRDTYCILVGDFEVRVRVRRVIRQKAHVRAKCVRGKTSKCGVRACDGKFVALQNSTKRLPKKAPAIGSPKKLQKLINIV